MYKWEVQIWGATHCTSNQVSFRISLFPKSCYALDRACFAGHNELWVIKNGCILREIHGFKVSYVNMFVLCSFLLAWFNENDCWFVNVHDEMNALVCCFLILVANCFWLENPIDEQDEFDTVAPKTLNVKPRTRFGLLEFYFCMKDTVWLPCANHCLPRF